MSKPRLPNLSFVIPAYNAGAVLDGCLDSLNQAMSRVSSKAWEVIIVNDGSTDNTRELARTWAKVLPVKIVDHAKNQGRFVARKAGIKQAKYDWLFLLDTKVLLDETALVFLSQQLTNHPERKVWNAHVRSDAQHNIIAAFNEASVMLAWGRYLRKPRLVSFGGADFDYYPKGTTCLCLPTALLREALAQFKKITSLHHVSDDTRLLRYVVSQTNIWLSPRFSCFYQARSSVRQSIPWMYNRGTLFIDSYLHRSARFLWPIILTLIAVPIFIVALIWQPLLIVLPVGLWLFTMAYLWFRLPMRHWWAVVELSIPYAAVFLVGLYAGSYLRLVNKRAHTQPTTN